MRLCPAALSRLTLVLWSVGEGLDSWLLRVCTQTCRIRSSRPAFASHAANSSLLIFCFLSAAKEFKKTEREQTSFHFCFQTEFSLDFSTLAARGFCHENDLFIFRFGVTFCLKAACDYIFAAAIRNLWQPFFYLALERAWSSIFVRVPSLTCCFTQHCSSPHPSSQMTVI